jgi:[ribosomal protein S18]-alanine N-acetyltransferase
MPSLLSVDVGAATDEDRQWAASLMASSEPWLTLGRGFDRCLQVCHDPEYLMFTARRDAERCGFLLLQRRGVAGSPYVVSLAVAPQARSQGVGGRLLAFAEEYVRPVAAHMFLCVSSFNGRARHFYETHGYVVEAHLTGYVIPDASELLMHKRLTSA